MLECTYEGIEPISVAGTHADCRIVSPGVPCLCGCEEMRLSVAERMIGGVELASKSSE